MTKDKYLLPEDIPRVQNLLHSVEPADVQMKTEEEDEHASPVTPVSTRKNVSFSSQNFSHLFHMQPSH
jgi:hypothetical protein